MSNFHRGGRGGFNGPRDHKIFGASHSPIREHRIQPWEHQATPGATCNRAGGGLLPTPTLPPMGLLHTPIIPGNDAALNALYLPNRQYQQTNQLPSLLGSPPPSIINPFSQNFRGRGSLGTCQDNVGTRPSAPSRRSEPYSKMGNRNQRLGQNSDDRKTSNVSPRRAVRGPGLSPKNVGQHARNTKEEKGDNRKTQKTVNSSREIIDDKNIKNPNNKPDPVKIKAEFADIPCDLLTCHVCLKDLRDSVSFVSHLKSKDHLSMMERQEEQYKAHTEKLREQMKIEEHQRQNSLRQNNSPGKFSHPNNEYCAMCNLHFSGHITQHRKSSKHLELKIFLHPKCSICEMEFPTRLDFDQHLLTLGHLKTKAANKCEDGNKSSNQQESQVSHVKSQRTEADSKTFVKPEAVMKKAPNNSETRTPLKGILKLEGRNKDSGLSKSIEPEEEKYPDYDSQKEIGMEMLQEKTGFLCKCCNRFLSSSSDAKTHCRSQFHYDKYITYIKSQPIVVVKSPKRNGNENSPSTKNKVKEDTLDEVKPKVDDKLDEKSDLAKAEEDDKSEETSPKEDGKQDVAEPEEEEEEEEEDEGNWKRRKVATDDDLSMDVSQPLIQKESTREERSEDQERELLGTDSKDEQSTEENTHSSSVNTVTL